MNKIKLSKLTLIKGVLWGTILLSSLALVYHTRWLVSFLLDSIAHRVPSGQSPTVWFIVQITSNIIFLYVGYLLIRLFNRYQEVGYFDKYSVRVFDSVILSCFGLAFLGILKMAFSNFYHLPLDLYNSIEGVANLIFFFSIDIVTFKEPQTMYFLLALVLWVVKQFVTRAIIMKAENESFV